MVGAAGGGDEQGMLHPLMMKKLYNSWVDEAYSQNPSPVGAPSFEDMEEFFEVRRDSESSPVTHDSAACLVCARAARLASSPPLT